MNFIYAIYILCASGFKISPRKLVSAIHTCSVITLSFHEYMFKISKLVQDIHELLTLFLNLFLGS